MLANGTGKALVLLQAGRHHPGGRSLPAAGKERLLAVEEELSRAIFEIKMPASDRRHFYFPPLKFTSRL